MVRLIACTAEGALAEPLADIPEAILDACQATAALYRKVGFEPPWIGYVSAVGDIAVGGGAFVGPPHDNRVEIAYFTLPEFERRGHARLTAQALITLARTATPTIELYAKTLPTPNASTRILRHLGFEMIGMDHDDDAGEVWAWLNLPR